ncbi:hypothetical protein PLESTM_001833400 [Pleodorina starrii]|nr:hypothetical protein PLESTM_001833400 [Pleodorina starrii]
MAQDTGAHSSTASRSSSLSSELWSGESFGTRVVRFAGSFSSSVGEYLADLTTAWTSSSDVHTSDAQEATHHTLVEGELVWIPRASSSCVPHDKKHK